MRRIQLELRACKDKLAEMPQDFFDNLILRAQPNTLIDNIVSLSTNYAYIPQTMEN